MSLDSYNPVKIEALIYQQWLSRNDFAPADASKQPPASPVFCIVIPPPNVTGELHLGHAWDCTLQDILTRWMRMEGYRTLWLPGTDHAGIATQWMVVAQLKAEGKSKEELGREAFLERVWQFKEESHQRITDQLKRLGVSCDWSRERFTLDKTLSRAVHHAFVKLYQAGLIYRGPRMVNWSPQLRSAVSDLEVEHRNIKGNMFMILYPFEDGPLPDGRKGIVIATTRPETMLADGAVAVHPADKRYLGLAGKNLVLPLVGRKIPLIEDNYVQQEFGSGAVKISAGHDFNDFEISKRHNLPVYQVMDEAGCMCGDIPQRYVGLERYHARKKIVADLKSGGFLVKIEQHEHSVGYCSRSEEPVEPRVSTQWFVRTEGMASKALEAVESKCIRLVPSFQEKIFAEWMNNPQDWCISRQLWWGHRIPVWYCEDCGESTVAEETPLVCQNCQSQQIRQDQDVLDTWFSSSLWPFSTMGWPKETPDLKTFFPTSLLVTGYDILFFWVARMAMMSLQLLGKIPFDEVLLHGLLRDEKGVKMSKTKGNGLNPLQLVDRYGADALRMALAAGTNLGHDMSLAESTCGAMRNFINKLWNATRFVLAHKERLGEPLPLPSSLPAELSLFETWIMVRLQEVILTTRKMLKDRRFNEATKVLYAFVWHEYCDWYLEASKPTLKSSEVETPAQRVVWSVSHHVLLEILKLLHPIVPFVTEHLWAIVQPQAKPLIATPYPQGMANKAQLTELQQVAAKASHLISVVQVIRTVRSESMVPPKARLQAQVGSTDNALCHLLKSQGALFFNLAGLASVELKEQLDAPKSWARGVGDGFEIALCLAGLEDNDKELARLEKEQAKLQVELNFVRNKLGNRAFITNAPQHVVEKNQQKMVKLEAQAQKLQQSLARLSA